LIAERVFQHDPALAAVILAPDFNARPQTDTLVGDPIPRFAERLLGFGHVKADVSGAG
jgi:hypothetical protein